MITLRYACIVVLLFGLHPCISQSFFLGADLSYVNAIEDGNGQYRSENGHQIDPFEFFASKGCQMVRARLWHTPENNQSACGPITSGSLPDVIKTFQRAKSAGMALKLAIHYGDYFVDPGKQKRPKAWDGLSHEVLLDSIETYTTQVLNALKNADVLPDIVAIGNETTWGFIDASTPTNGWSWSADADKFNAGLAAVEAFNQANNTSIQSAVHFTDKTARELAKLFADQGIANFDIIGVSFYPMWSEFTHISQLGTLISQLKTSYQKEVMIFEAGAPWTTGGSDNYGNFMSGYGPVQGYQINQADHRQFLLDLSDVVYEAGGMGILYWEPAWISSNMCDLWGRGSSYENVGFFDFNNGNRATSSFDFFSANPAILSGQFPKNKRVYFYPNPVQDTVFVEGLDENARIEIYDLTGRLQHTTLLRDARIDLSTLPSGGYFLAYSIGQESQSQLIVKK